MHALRDHLQRAGKSPAGRVLCVFFIALLALRLWPRPPLSAWVPTSTAVLSADGELLRLTLAADQQYRVWTPLAAISPTLIDAVQLHEDRWFYWHPGVNPVALVRGALRTYGVAGMGGGNRQGGSTLTMQLARLLYGLNTRTPAGKLRQVSHALWLEARYGKRELLEAYLNLAPYGGNVQGVGAASLIYFGKQPTQLTLGEALALAVIPQQPNARGGRNSAGATLENARRRLLTRWREHQITTDADASLAQLPVTLRPLTALPFRAPHFVDAILARGGNLPAQLQTTLDASLQRVLERQVRLYIEQRRASGVSNAVALLLDPRDMSVKAWLGSANYFDERIDGQVNGVLAKRSPGSTLKPFIYALALDQGLLHPRTILKDAPIAFGPFAPENFDGRFTGPITAQDALIHSRNVPAVAVAAQLRNPGLYQFLQSAGIAQLQSEQHYGLALVLGGGEVTMEESVSLYAMLVNGGRLQPLRYRRDDPLARGPELISPQASFIALDMLAHNPRPDGASQFATDARWPVAWKTGTSWGFRDAWSVGAVGPYVLAVWIGNFDGSGNPAFVGIDTAAPLFFRIADALRLARPQAVAARRSAPPPGVARIEVCAASGDLPNRWCPQREPTWYIPGKSPIRVSTLHRPVAVDRATGEPVCPPYDPRRVREEIYEFWASDMLRLFRRAGMPRRTPPACADTGSADAPAITSPLRTAAYTLRRSRPDENIALQANAAGAVKTLFWFHGNRFLGRASPNSALAWRPDHSGVFDLRVVDDRGAVAQRDVVIEMVP